MADILFLCRCILGFTFAWSAIGKLRDVSSFGDVIESFNFFSNDWNYYLAWILISFELVTVFLLLTSYHFYGFSSSIILLSIFSVILLILLKKRQKVNCNCFGPSHRIVTVFDIYRNFVFISVAIVGILVTGSTSESTVSLPHTLILLSLSAIIVFFLTSLGDIVKLVQNPTILR